VKIVKVPATVLGLGEPTSEVEPEGVATHGDRPGRSVIEKCPECGFAYADGGYCPECGWTMFHSHCPHCIKKGNK
jgi:hypothetical protein